MRYYRCDLGDIDCDYCPVSHVPRPLLQHAVREGTDAVDVIFLTLQPVNDSRSVRPASTAHLHAP